MKKTLLPVVRALTGAAAYNNNPQIIDTLVALGADVNQKVFFDDTALIIAARYAKNPAVIEALLNNGADPMHLNVKGQLALDIARHYKNKAGADAIALSQIDSAESSR